MNCDNFPGRRLCAGLIGFLLLVWGTTLAAGEATVATPHSAVPGLSEAEQQYLASLPALKVPLIAHQPPITFVSDGRPAGYLNDLLDILAVKLGLSIQRVSGLDYEQSLQALKSRDVDLLNDYSLDQTERDYALHTRPVLEVPFVAVGRASDPHSVKSIDDLRDKRLVLVSGYQQTETIRGRYPELQVLLVDNLVQAYSALRSRDADYYIDNATHAGFHLLQQMLTDLQIKGQLPAEQVGTLQLRFAVHTGHPLLHSALQKALDGLDREVQLALREKWLTAAAKAPMLDLSSEQRAWLAEHPHIRLASDHAWPPFEFIDDQGNYKGIAADYMRLLEQRLGITFVPSPRKRWSEITEMVKNRELDVYSLAMETAQRSAYANFTRPYVSNPMVIVTDHSVSYVDGIEGLSGKPIAIERGYASYDLLSANHPQLLLKAYPDSLSAMLAVSRGEAFAYVGNIATLSHVVRDQGLTNIKISGQLPYRFELAMGVRDDWPELVPILQKALDSISVEEKNAILQKWISVRLAEEFDFTLLWQIAGVVLLLFLAVLYWNLLLKRRVRERTSQLLYQAHYDALTNLPNRALALDRLSQLINEAHRHGDNIGLLFLDLDDFKKVNDTLGHEVGDKLLISVANRLRDAVRASDTVARLGGDEFIVLLGELHAPGDAGMVAENLLACFHDAFEHDGREFLFTVSIGIAVYPDDGDFPSTLLRNADSAMYHSKHQGRNTYSYYTDTMNLEVARRLQVEGCMHGALERGEFSVYYQPKLDIGDCSIVGFEALLRWHCPELGEVSPYEFIPIAEHNGAISELGRFVLSEALATTADWQAKFQVRLRIAVNLSPRQFRDPSLVEHIATLLERHGIHSDCLELEITEGVLMSGSPMVEQMLGELKQLGVRIAMDDFGTGYSSLSYLRKYPFDIIKIDREFIDDLTSNPADQQLTRAAIAMAHGLGLKVVAEGVETQEQLTHLATSRCDLAQGYLFSKPLPLAQARQLLQDQADGKPVLA